MAKKDITSKHILKHIVKDIAKYVFKMELDETEFLETEQQRVEQRRADLVIKARQGSDTFILHIEMQNDNQKLMPLRMLRYYTDIAFSYPDLEIKQYLIYIGKPALSMPDGIENKSHQYKYHLVDMHKIDCHVLMAENNPHAVVLAILCDFKKASKRDVIKKLLLRIQQLTIDNDKQYRDCILALEILSENRDLKALVKEEEKMLSEIKLENLPSYEIGFERGEARGEAKGEAIGEAKEKKRSDQKITYIIVSMLPFFDDSRIQQVTGIDIATIKDIRDKNPKK